MLRNMGPSLLVKPEQKCGRRHGRNQREVSIRSDTPGWAAACAAPNCLDCLALGAGFVAVAVGPGVTTVPDRQNDQAATLGGRGTSGSGTPLPASASASVAAEGFRLSTIELGIRIVAPRSLVVS